MLTATKSRTSENCFSKRVTDTYLSELTRTRADDRSQWMLENIMKLLRTGEHQTFADAGNSSERVQLLPHQRLTVVTPACSGGSGGPHLV